MAGLLRFRVQGGNARSPIRSLWRLRPCAPNLRIKCMGPGDSPDDDDQKGGLALTFRQPAAHTRRPAREANHASTEAEGRVRSENRTLIVRRLVVVVILFSGHRLVLAALARPILVRPILTWLCLTRIYLTGISLVRSTLTRVSLTGVALIGIILSTLARIALTTSQIVTHHVTFRFKHDAECAESKDQLAQQAFVPVQR